MSYRFPVNRIASGEPTDPRLFDQNSRPVAQELSGSLNENNIKAGEFTRTQVAQKAFYDFYYRDVASDPQFSTSAGRCLSTDPDAFIVPDSGEWVAVPDMDVQVTTGEDLLWVIGWAQYGMTPETTAYNVTSGFTSNKARLQFAIRVAGSVIASSITGMQDLSWSAPMPIHPNDPLGDTASIHTFRTPGCQSLMFPVHPVRFQAHVPVQGGTHLVEIVVRRIAADGAYADQTATAVCVFSRKLLVIKVVQNAPATGTASDVSLNTHEDGDVMSAASLYTNDQEVLQDALNAVADGSIARHGLRKEHLPSLILYPNQVGLSTGNATNQPYPGFGSDRDPSGGAGDWVYVDDGFGANLETTNGPFDFSVTPGFVLILANVFLGELESQAGLTTYFGCFGIGGMYSSGALFANPSSEAYVNSPNVAPFGNGILNTDVPLLEFYDYRTSPPAGGEVEKWYVAASAYPFSAEWIRSNMLMIIFSRGA